MTVLRPQSCPAPGWLRNGCVSFLTPAKISEVAFCHLEAEKSDGGNLPRSKYLVTAMVKDAWRYLCDYCRPPAGSGTVSMSTIRIFYFTVIVLVICQTATANGSCVCRCVNGRMQSLCTSVNDMPAFCPPSTLCPIAAPPTLAPLGPPIAPPVGTRSCFQRQILNPATGQYEWNMLCR